MIRTLFLFTISFLPLIASMIDVQKIATRIDTISNSKISNKVDYNVYDPFATAKPILKKKTIVKRAEQKNIVLETILNNRVFIERKWYSTGSYIHGYKIKNISANGIIITKNHKTLLIPLNKNKNLLKIKENLKWKF